MYSRANGNPGMNTAVGRSCRRERACVRENVKDVLLGVRMAALRDLASLLASCLLYAYAVS
jgi:hypothetical protein